MRIGIDARELCGHATGAGRYLGGLLHEWETANEAARHEFILYTPEPLKGPFAPRRFAVRLVPGKPGTWWEQARLPPVATAIISTSFRAGLLGGTGCRCRLSCDPRRPVLRASEWFGTREASRRWLTRQSARRAARWSRSPILATEIRRAGVPEARVHVIPWRRRRRHGRRMAARNEFSCRLDSTAGTSRIGFDRSRSSPGAGHPYRSTRGDNRTYPHEDAAHSGRGPVRYRVRWHRYAEISWRNSTHVHGPPPV